MHLDALLKEKELRRQLGQVPFDSLLKPFLGNEASSAQKCV